MASKTPAGRPAPIRKASLPAQPVLFDDNPLKTPKTPRKVESGTSPVQVETALLSEPSPTAQTFPNVAPESRFQTKSPATPEADAFETADNSEAEDGANEATRGSIDLDDLPIELVKLTDNFIESLGAKVHATPPSVDRLSQLFQDFYASASSHINKYVDNVASTRGRDSSPAPSVSSISSAASRFRSKSNLSLREKAKPEAEQQMITSEELATRKRERRAIEARKGLLEEAVERRLCEGIYDRIYRHRTTQDEAQDDQLRSKTAALAVVGITPADLGVDLGDEIDQDPAMKSKRIDEIRVWLEKARKDLIAMNESRYPLGKTNHLKAAHKSIVDTLANFHPSASADEIMPMLIYTLITLPPENLNVISDLHFVQNFRWTPKLTGEAAYCLTNLEAAIGFLQTVDLATLRADEHPSGPPKNQSQPGTPKTETFPLGPFQGMATASQGVAEVNSANATLAKPGGAAAARPNHILRNRRLSDLVNTPAQAFGAASDAVIASADQRLKDISNSLGDSYKFLVGKLKEQKDSPTEPIVVPRTLDDARKLISTPPPEDEDIVDPEAVKTQDRVLNMIGRRRDPSVESTRSGRSASSSNKRVLFAEEAKGAPAALGTSPGQNPAMLEQMRNLGNTFNPMARLSNISMIRGFGRNTSQPPTPTGTTVKENGKDGGDLATAFPDIVTSLPPKKTPQIQIPHLAPPNKRYMEMQSPGDLKLNEVIDLLKDYRRLANALKDLGAFDK